MYTGSFSRCTSGKTCSHTNMIVIVCYSDNTQKQKNSERLSYYTELKLMNKMGEAWEHAYPNPKPGKK